MTFDWATFLFQLVNLIVLLAILKHFLFRPVAQIIAARKAEISAALAEAEDARSRAEAATEAARAEADRTASARQDVLARAREDAAAERERLLKEARAEAGRLIETARSKAADTLKEAETAALTRACNLAEAIAARALAALPAPPTTAGFTARLAETVAAMSARDRKDLIGAGDLRLVSAHPLTEEEKKDVYARIPELASAGTEIAVDPELIAGLELRSASGTIHNSLAHDLSRIAKAMEDGLAARD